MHLTNNASESLPYGYNPGDEWGSAPPPQYHNTYPNPNNGSMYARQQQQQRGGFVEQDEVLTESDFPSQGRRGSGNGSGGAGFLNTLAQQAMSMDKSGKGKDLVGKFMSK